jgi:hypothetical protein
MSPLKLWLIIALVIPPAFAGPALAQGTNQRNVTTQGTNQRNVTTQGTAARARTPVATQPSNDPFHNPIGQGVAPAASANSNQNGNITNVPR